MVFDQAEALDRAGDDTLLWELVQLFREESVRLLLELRGAAAKGDAVELQRLAHTLKGSAATVAAHAVSQAARDVEMVARSDSLRESAETMAVLEQEMSRLLPVLEAATILKPAAD
jgi:two-component system sensor histidine kinase/response regulator